MVKRYSSYKNTGFSWCANIPSHWESKKLIEEFGFGKGLPITKENLLSCGIPVISYGQIHAKNNTGVRISKSLLRFVSPDYLNTNMESLVHKGDFIFADTSEDRDGCGNCVYIDKEITLFAGYHCIILRCKKGECDNKYLAYLFLTDAWREQIRTLVEGVKLFSITKSKLRKSKLFMPPMQEQQQIVRYLDWKTSQINHLIHGYERLISLLEERKTAVINEAVTKGIRKGVAVKKCPIQEIDSIPSHWKIVKAQRIFKEFNNLAESDNETVLSLSQKDGLIPFDKLKERTLQTSSYENWKQVYPGELVLNRFKAHLGVFFSSKYRGIVTFHYGVYTPIIDINSTYFEYLFHTEAYKTIYAGLSNGMTVGLQNLSNTAFYSSYVILPPLEEQNAIVDFLSSKIDKVDNAINSAHNQIVFLQERRTRLISDVVTGAVDVRDIAVPEYAPEQDMEVTEDGDEYEGERA